MTPSAHRPGGGSLRDRVIMIRDHIHKLLSAESRLPFLSTRVSGADKLWSLLDLARFLEPKWPQSYTVQPRRGTFEVEGGTKDL